MLLKSNNVFWFDFVQLCSVVLMSGLIIILSSAAKITHQAQALTGQTTKWHACCTIEPVPDEEAEPGSNHSSMLEVEPVSDSDGESSEETGDEDLLENTKIMLPQAHVISFQKRQALGKYRYSSNNFMIHPVTSIIIVDMIAKVVFEHEKCI